jgi:hypothetical protein
MDFARDAPIAGAGTGRIAAVPLALLAGATLALGALQAWPREGFAVVAGEVKALAAQTAPRLRAA